MGKGKGEKGRKGEKKREKGKDSWTVGKCQIAIVSFPFHIKDGLYLLDPSHVMIFECSHYRFARLVVVSESHSMGSRFLALFLPSTESALDWVPAYNSGDRRFFDLERFCCRRGIWITWLLEGGVWVVVFFAGYCYHLVKWADGTLVVDLAVVMVFVVWRCGVFVGRRSLGPLFFFFFFVVDVGGFALIVH